VWVFQNPACEAPECEHFFCARDFEEIVLELLVGVLDYKFSIDMHEQSETMTNIYGKNFSIVKEWYIIFLAPNSAW
jgi:hypothetical protein